MEPSQGEIIQKSKTQELSSLFLTYDLSVMHALVQFHKYIPYGLGVIAHNVKFHEYIPYSLGVMARTLFTICN